MPQLLVALTTAAEEDVAIPSTVEDEVDADDPPPPPPQADKTATKIIDVSGRRIGVLPI